MEETSVNDIQKFTFELERMIEAQLNKLNNKMKVCIKDIRISLDKYYVEGRVIDTKAKVEIVI